jgi:2-hydroxycyclohexanecarboxyl-CoA dehydrogenase
MQPNHNHLRGGVAVVVGGAGVGAGLGSGLVRGFAAVGMRVAILDANELAAQSLAHELRVEGKEALSYKADLRDRDTLLSAAEQVRNSFGACNVLCAHAGGGGQLPFEMLTPDIWRDTFEFTVIGTVAVVQAFLPLMRQTNGLRRIVLTASVAALAPGVYQGAYRAAKAAVVSIGETLDLEFANEGIGTTIVFPSGMLPPAVLEARHDSNDEQAMEQLVIPDEMQKIMVTLAAEMAPDPTDTVTGAAAAEPVVAAVIAGQRYVVTHGITVEQNYRKRQGLIDEAFANLAARHYLPGAR